MSFGYSAGDFATAGVLAVQLALLLREAKQAKEDFRRAATFLESLSRVFIEAEVAVKGMSDGALKPLKNGVEFYTREARRLLEEFENNFVRYKDAFIGTTGSSSSSPTTWSLSKTVFKPIAVQARESTVRNARRVAWVICGSTDVRALEQRLGSLMQAIQTLLTVAHSKGMDSLVESIEKCRVASENGILEARNETGKCRDEVKGKIDDCANDIVQEIARSKEELKAEFRAVVLAVQTQSAHIPRRMDQSYVILVDWFGAEHLFSSDIMQNDAQALTLARDYMLPNSRSRLEGLGVDDGLFYFMKNSLMYYASMIQGISEMAAHNLTPSNLPSSSVVNSSRREHQATTPPRRIFCEQVRDYSAELFLVFENGKLPKQSVIVELPRDFEFHPNDLPFLKLESNCHHDSSIFTDTRSTLYSITIALPRNEHGSIFENSPNVYFFSRSDYEAVYMEHKDEMVEEKAWARTYNFGEHRTRALLIEHSRAADYLLPFFYILGSDLKDKGEVTIKA